MPSNKNKKTKRQGSSRSCKQSSATGRVPPRHVENHENNNDNNRLPQLVDESSSSVGDPLLGTIRRLRRDASRLGLLELEKVLRLLDVNVTENSREGIDGTLQGVKRGFDSSRPATLPQIRTNLEIYLNEVKEALNVFTNPDSAMSISESDARSTNLLKLLGPTSKFDMGHEFAAMQETMLATMRGAKAEQNFEVEIRQFEATKPVDKLREKEPGFAKIKRKAEATVNTAALANELGRYAWKAGGKWSAELCWELATKFDDVQAKHYSNLAHVRIVLGRHLRSMCLGYRRLAEQLLEHAISDAQKGVKLDPQWERSYQRWAEALLVLGPYNRAVDACRVLKKAMDALEQPSATLVSLSDKANANAALWFRLKLPPGEATTIPQMVNASMAYLRSAVVRSLAIEALSSDEQVEVGQEIVDAATLVKASLQLIYIRRSKWIRESKAAGMDGMQIQIQLRQAAKLVPVSAIHRNDALKNLVFMEEPFSIWGLDRLDRKGVSTLKLDAKDPCSADFRFEGDEDFSERMKRMMGGDSLDLRLIKHVTESVSGKKADSYERDMSPHHLCAFSISILQRVVMTNDSPMQRPATERVVDLMMSPNQNGAWAGGEFLGMALNAAAGIGRYDLERDMVRFEQFIRTHGAMAAIAKEIFTSNDDHFYIQEMVAQLTPDCYARMSAYDIVNLLYSYLLSGMDDDVLGTSRKEIAPYVTKIFAALLDGHPNMIHYFRTGDPPSMLTGRRFFPLFKSGFGIFIMRRFMRTEQGLLEQNKPRSTIHVMKLLVESWTNLSKRKRSAFRWDSFGDDMKKQLSNLAPVDREDLLKTRQAEKEKGRGDEPTDEMTDIRVAKLPECARCGKRDGLGVELLHCPCKVVRYCSNHCQKLHWKEHKNLCKEKRSTSS